MASLSTEKWVKYPLLSEVTRPASRRTLMCWDTAASEIPSLLAIAPAHMSWFRSIVTILNRVSSDIAFRVSAGS